MKPVVPYIDENKQVIFIEFENEHVHNWVNGFILGFVVFLPLVLIVYP